MRSSISNSDLGRGLAAAILRRSAITLLVSAIILIAIFEFGTRSIVYRVSKNLSRIHREALSASQISGEGGGRQQVLLVGNSLLLHDVDIGQLERGLLPNQNAKQFAIQATTYYDWYYGVRGLLAEGSRPDLIVVCLEARHILLSSVRSEIFAYYLMQWRDLFDVRRSLKLSPAETFDLLLANISNLYALRKEMRQVLLQRILPDLPQLTTMIARAPKPLPDPVALRTIGKDRMVAFQELVVGSGTLLLLLLMPPIQSDALEAVREVGREIGMPVLTPLALDDITDNDYQADGYHLNQQGREKFTKALLPLLAQLQTSEDSLN